MAVAHRADGGVVLAGGFWRTMSLGDGPLVAVGTSDDDIDAFVATFDAQGNSLASKRFGAAGRDEVTAIAVEPQGQMVIAGSFANEIDFGNGPLTRPAVDPGGEMAFIAKLAP